MKFTNKGLLVFFLSILLLNPLQSQNIVEEGWYYLDDNHGDYQLVRYNAFFESPTPVDVDLSTIAESDLTPMVFTPMGGLASVDGEGIFLNHPENGEKEYLYSKSGVFDDFTLFQFDTDSSIFYTQRGFLQFTINHLDLKSGLETVVFSSDGWPSGMTFDSFRNLLWVAIDYMCWYSGCFQLISFDLATNETTLYQIGAASAPIYDSYGSLYFDYSGISYDFATASLDRAIDNTNTLIPYFKRDRLEGATLGISRKNVFFEQALINEKDTVQFTFYNYGVSPLILQDFDLDAPFYANLTEPLEVPPGGNLAFEIVFEPTQSGLIETYLTFSTNDTNHALDSIRLVGTGYQINKASSADGLYYIHQNSESGTTLRKANPSSGSIEEIGSLYSNAFSAQLAIDSRNYLYTVMDSDLFLVDSKTGAKERLDTLYDWGYDNGMGITSIDDIDFDSDDNLIIVYAYIPGPKGNPRSWIEKYNMQTRQKIKSIDLEPGIYDLAINRATNQYYLLRGRKDLGVIENNGFKVLGELSHDQTITAIFFNPAGSLLGVTNDLDYRKGPSILFSIDQSDFSTNNLVELGNFTAGVATLSSSGVLLTAHGENDHTRVYPNPTSGFLHVESLSPQKTLESLSLFDLSGQMLFECKEVNSNSFDLYLENGSITRGVYLLRIDSKGGRRIVKRIIVE